jgi:hypothetical protein
MILVCVNPFGNFTPGDEVLIPDDDAVFDRAFFTEKDAKPETDASEHDDASAPPAPVTDEESTE